MLDELVSWNEERSCGMELSPEKFRRLRADVIETIKSSYDLGSPMQRDGFPWLAILEIQGCVLECRNSKMKRNTYTQRHVYLWKCRNCKFSIRARIQDKQMESRNMGFM